ncbi:MAG: bile acid:sodium symporter [Devosia nanyangense]|uniref:Bile acid:sodium symporter n=1 Tax=Devosia nanyangense TaxID=1228055 RepID=A0A933NXT5_9HYPH|nr:bile acid:sodium symporter [Devosia nanyangense]
MTIRGFTIDGFLLALAAVVLAAILLPALGATGGVLHIDWIATYGVAGVFFLYGLTLAPEKLRQGAANWRVHVTVQLATFVLFPVLVLVVLAFFPNLPEPVATGFFYLAALPSTVSSSVAMTSLARGNVPTAIFNATLSSLLGVFLTPILMAWYASTTGAALPLLPAITKVVLLVLLPIVVGQIARHWLERWANRHIKAIRLTDRAIILAIVFNSFSDSMREGIWTGHDATLVIGMCAGVIGLFFVVYGLLQIPCRLLGLDREDTIACLFCGSKKSLATGVPLAKLLFGSVPTLGLIIAPIMLYHFFQLIIVSVIANRYARRAPA